MSKFPRPFYKWFTYPKHVGIDYPEPNDTIVRASAKGVVTFSGFASARAGYAVAVNYGNGMIQWYKHSDEEDWRAPVGTMVELGTPIMEVGKLGVGSTGYHLHHEVFVNGVIQTGENYWRYVDKSENGYVGAPSSADNGSKPLPTVKKEDEEMLGRFTFKRKDDGATVRVVHGEQFYEEHTDPAIKNADINSTYNLPPDAPWVNMPESYRDVVYNACLATRTGAQGAHRPPK